MNPATVFGVNIKTGRAALAGLTLLVIGLFSGGCGNEAASPPLSTTVVQNNEVVKQALLKGWTYDNSAGMVDDWRASASAQLEEEGAVSKPSGADIVILAEDQEDKRFVRFLFHGQERKVMAYTIKGVGIGEHNPHYGDEVRLAILDMADIILKEEIETLKRKIGKKE